MVQKRGHHIPHITESKWMVDPSLDEEESGNPAADRGAGEQESDSSHGRTQKCPRARGHWVLLSGLLGDSIKYGN